MVWPPIKLLMGKGANSPPSLPSLSSSSLGLIYAISNGFKDSGVRLAFQHTCSREVYKGANT
jgi:hypothetical protein